MLFYTFLCNVLFTIPLIYGSNSTLPRTEHNSSATKLLSSKETKDHNKAKITLVSEGGSDVSDVPVSILLKQNHTAVMTDKELSKSKIKSVVPRKGVVYEPPEESKERKNENQISVDIPSELKSTQEKSNTELKKTITFKENNDSLISKIRNNTENVNNTQTHKKPLKLSYEVLATADKDFQNNHLKLPEIKSSSKTLDSDQIPSPNNEKFHLVNNNRHPGMVMPIVITILVVPMFAVLGYMALKRGQEAWKNRHYKRMDFLLDGMYND